MKLLVMATLVEAKATIKALNAVEETPSIYLWEKGKLVISGLGVLAAAYAVARHGVDADEIWNLGIAGALHETYPIGTLYSISTVSKHLSLPTDCDQHARTFSLSQVFPELHLSSRKDFQAEGLRLLSSDYPIYNPTLRTRLASDYDLVDMEGYGVVMAAAQLKKPCYLKKLVSDLASPEGFLMIRNNIDSYSDRLSRCIVDFLLMPC